MRKWIPLAAASAVCLVAVAVPVAALQDEKNRERDRAKMEKELNEAGDLGYQLQSVMGGETALGGKEAVAVMAKPEGSRTRFQYKLLATDIYKQVIGQFNFQMGAVVGIFLLMPAVLSFAVYRIVQRKQFAILSARAVPLQPKKRPLADALGNVFRELRVGCLVGEDLA